MALIVGVTLIVLVASIGPFIWGMYVTIMHRRRSRQVSTSS